MKNFEKIVLVIGVILTAALLIRAVSVQEETHELTFIMWDNGTTTTSFRNFASIDSSNSCSIIGGKINTAKPIQLYLRNDVNLRAENLDPASVAGSIAKAANTWDYCTKPGQNNLFKPTVIVDARKAADKKDGYSTIAFRQAPVSYISYARTWYSADFKYIIETDIVYNIDRQWTTDFAASQSTNGQIKDVQTMALHELGHACGLGDLYALPAGDPRKSDYGQIMNGYHGAQRVLGLGDIAGMKKLYG